MGYVSKRILFLTVVFYIRIMYGQLKRGWEEHPLLELSQVLTTINHASSALCKDRRCRCYDGKTMGGSASTTKGLITLPVLSLTLYVSVTPPVKTPGSSGLLVGFCSNISGLVCLNS